MLWRRGEGRRLNVWYEVSPLDGLVTRSRNSRKTTECDDNKNDPSSDVKGGQ